MHPLKSLLPRNLLSCPIVPEGGCGAPMTHDTEITALLREAMESKRSVILYVSGTTLAAAVQEVKEHVMIGKSREHTRIVVRLDRVDGVAMF